MEDFPLPDERGGALELEDMNPPSCEKDRSSGYGDGGELGVFGSDFLRSNIRA